jgi:hypothetical protein
VLRGPKPYFFVNFERDLTPKKKAEAERQAAKFAKKHGESSLNVLGGGLPVYVGDFDEPRFLVTAEGEWLTPGEADEKRVAAHLDATMRGDVDAMFADPSLLFSGVGGALIRGELDEADESVGERETRGDPAERLKKLAELRDAGIVSDEEFRAKKAELLDEI